MSTATRLQLARDLHDGIAQDLVALGYELDLLLAKQGSTVESRVEIRTLRFRVDDLISKVRREMYQLREKSEVSLQDELQKIAFEICGPLLSRVEIEIFDIPKSIQIELKAIAIELLRNAANHSGASQIELILHGLQNRTYLEVGDDGVGGAEMDTKRLGLVGIKERVDLLKGNLAIASNENGTRIKIVL